MIVAQKSGTVKLIFESFAIKRSSAQIKMQKKARAYMNLNMQILADRLDTKGPGSYNIEGRSLNLQDVRLFLNGPILPTKHDFVYITTYECLRTCSSPSEHMHLICLGHVDEAVELAKVWGGSWIFLADADALDTVFNQVLELFRFFRDCNARFLDAIAEGESIDDCLGIAAEMLGNPMFIIDTAMTITALAKRLDDREMNEAKWFAVVNEGRVTVNALNDILKKGAEDPPRPMQAHFYSVYPQIFNSVQASIVVNGKPVAVLVIPDEFAPLRESDLALADYLVKFIPDMFQRHKILRGQQNSIIEQFISNLLNKMTFENRVIESYLMRINWKLRDRYLLIKVVAKEGCVNKELAYYDVKRIKNVFGSCFYLNYNEYLLFILNIRLGGAVTSEQFSAFNTLLKERDLKAGISTPFEHFGMLAEQYELVTDVIQRGKTGDGKEQIYQCADVVCEQIIRYFPEKINMLALCCPEIIRLYEYDRKHGTPFVDSLYCYLLNERSLKRASQQLHIHRNTLVYRIERIADICVLNYADPHTRYHAMLSCNILWTLDFSALKILEP